MNTAGHEHLGRYLTQHTRHHVASHCQPFVRQPGGDATEKNQSQGRGRRRKDQGRSRRKGKEKGWREVGEGREGYMAGMKCYVQLEGDMNIKEVNLHQLHKEKNKRNFLFPLYEKINHCYFIHFKTSTMK